MTSQLGVEEEPGQRVGVAGRKAEVLEGRRQALPKINDPDEPCGWGCLATHPGRLRPLALSEDLR
ncbi:MAG: hypothetical protein ACRDJ4_07405 [Actinomycetota bacterium]